MNDQLTVFDPESPQVTPQNLSEILYKDRKVVTTDLLAMFYGTEPKRIRDNFKYNESRFQDGKHYFKLQGQELREFKDYTANSGLVQIPKNSPSYLLWTKQGAARHSKMLGTDKAWDVFDELEEHYFTVKHTGMIAIDPAANQPEVLQLAADQARKLKEQEPLILIANNFLESDTEKTILQVSKEVGEGEKTLFKILREEKVFYYTWQNGKQVNVPYERHVTAKRFVVKNKTKEFKRSDGSVSKVNYSQIKVTAKGEAFICWLLEQRKERDKSA